MRAVNLAITENGTLYASVSVILGGKGQDYTTDNAEDAVQQVGLQLIFSMKTTAKRRNLLLT